eukprot:scaffold208572_cov51-Cyclotella_meneghiniana.AAC.4
MNWEAKRRGHITNEVGHVMDSNVRQALDTEVKSSVNNINNNLRSTTRQLLLVTAVADYTAIEW